MLQEIVQLHLSGRLDEAASRYRDVLAREPDNVDAMHLYGVLKRQTGELAEAQRLLEDARRRAPDRADVLLELAGVRFMERDTAGARQMAEAAVGLDPNLPGGHTLLGQIALADGDAATAETRYRTALRVNEDDAQALAGLGNVCVERGDAEMALRYLTRAAELAPNEALIQLALGRAFRAHGNAAFAEQALANAVRLRPELHAARHLLGQLLIETRRPQEAEAHFAVLGEAPAQKRAALLGLADAARGQGRLDLAAARYREALALDPKQPRAVHALGWCLAQLGRDAETLAAYTDYLALVPGDRFILAALADYHLISGRVEPAQEVWAEVLERYPDDGVAALRLALLCERSGEFVDALAYAQRAAQQFPTDPELELLQVRAALREERLDDAQRKLQALSHLNLNVGQTRLAAHYRGLVLDARGDVHAAVEAWRESQAGVGAAVHEQEPPSPQLTERLADAPGAASDDAPVFLLGLPGSEVERVAALLAEQPNLSLLRDRALAPLRQDDFAAPDFNAYLAGLDADGAAARRARYREELSKLGPRQGRSVDWLLRWDARFLPLLTQAFAGATVVLVERDPRDCLLNWLAYGWLPGFPCLNPEAAATWLAKARAHMNLVAQANGIRLVRVDPTQLLADPAGAGELAAALGLAQLVPGRPQLGLGGLRLGLPAGRWRAYADVLRPAFDRLEPAA